MSKYIVTGGAGFLGKALSTKLVQLGHEVISISRGSYPELEKLGIKSVQADLSKDLEIVDQTCIGADAIFHVAAKTDMWGDKEEFVAANVAATNNLLEIARLQKITKFIFTSSPSVVSRDFDLIDIDENYPYPDSYRAYYPETKAQAEKLVLAANSQELATVALRPHLIWGPGDTGVTKFIIEKGKLGKLTQIGDGNNLVDFTYIDDCVDAHILALEQLSIASPIAGQTFFISQDEPMKLWDFVSKVLMLNNLPAIRKKIPTKLALGIASILENIYKFLPKKLEPPFTRFIVSQMSTSHYFNISKARRLLGYNPQVSMEEGFRRTFGLGVG